jgi:hypothetical protein
LPYSQDFSTLAHTSTTYPAGWQGWQLSGNPGSSFKTTAPTGDKTLTAILQLQQIQEMFIIMMEKLAI